MIVDAWAQHRTPRFLRSDFIEATLAAMDAANVDVLSGPKC